MNVDDMRDLPPAELKSESDKLESRIWKMRFQARGEPVENSGQLRELKKERARMLTVLGQMRRGEIPVPTASGDASGGESPEAASDSGASGEE